MESDSVAPTDLSEGDQIEVTYVPAQAGVDGDETVLETEVVDSDPEVLDGFEFGGVYLAEYHDDEDTLPRRRLSHQAGSWDLECRRTTRNGAKWQRMNRTANCSVRRC